MNNSQDFKLDEGFGLLLQGPAGSGKTSLAMAFPKPGFIIGDNNLAGVVRRMKVQNYDKSFKWTKPEAGLDTTKPLYITNQWKNFLACINEYIASPEIQTVVIDNLSIYCDLCLRFIVEDAIRLEGKRLERPRIQDFGTAQAIWKDICTNLRLASKNVIVICHEEVEKDETQNGLLKYKPNVPGSKLQGQIGGFFSDVWRTETRFVGDNVAYWLRMAPSIKADLKNSLGTPNEVKIPEKFVDLETLINGYLKTK